MYCSWPVSIGRGGPVRTDSGYSNHDSMGPVVARLLLGASPGPERRPYRRTAGSDVNVRQPQTLGKKLIQVGSFHVVVAMAMRVAVALVVRNKQHHIRLLSCRNRSQWRRAVRPRNASWFKREKS